MEDNTFDRYKTRVLKAIIEIDRKANLAYFGDTLMRHYFDEGYSEESAAAAMLELFRRYG
jgi:hypothetical protein